MCQLQGSAPPPTLPPSAVAVFLCGTLSATFGYSGCSVASPRRKGRLGCLVICHCLLAYTGSELCLYPSGTLEKVWSWKLPGLQREVGARRSVTGVTGAASTQRGVFVSHLVTVISSPATAC